MRVHSHFIIGDHHDGDVIQKSNQDDHDRSQRMFLEDEHGQEQE